MRKLTAEEQAERIYERFGDSLTFFLETYKGSLSKSHFKCNDCGHEFDRRMDDLLSGRNGESRGCSMCGNGKVRKRDDVAKEIYDLSDGKYMMDVWTYTRMHKDASVLCADCGYVFETTPHELITKLKKDKESGCIHCNSTKLEKPILELLTSLHCDFDYNKALKGCRREGCAYDMKPDFLFKKYSLVFEVDGVQHYLPMHGRNTLEYLRKNDEYKNQYFKEKGYILIRASDDTNIKYATDKHITLTKLIELIQTGISYDGVVDIEIFRPYDFNR